MACVEGVAVGRVFRDGCIFFLPFDVIYEMQRTRECRAMQVER